jgi:hypothetical protein
VGKKGGKIKCIAALVLAKKLQSLKVNLPGLTKMVNQLEVYASEFAQ